MNLQPITLEPADIEEGLQAIELALPLGKHNPLFQCLLVTQKLSSPAFLRGDYAALHAVHQVLEECFIAVLGQEVHCIHFPKQIVFAIENRFLLAYQMLYFRYMRPDLSLSTEDLATLTGFTDRTARRRLEDGVQYLTLDVVRREIALRETVTSIQGEAQFTFVPLVKSNGNHVEH
jgi:hypothetical protein